MAPVQRPEGDLAVGSFYLPTYARTKDSGVEWLGRVPSHWTIRKIRQCASISGGMTPSMEDGRFWGGNVPWVTPKDMKTPVIGNSHLRVTDTALAETTLRLVQSPAVLMVVRGMILARRVPIARTTAPVTINQDMKALAPSPALNAAYMASFLGCAHDGLFPLIDEAGHGTRRLPTERWQDLPVATPSEAEQTAIVRFLDYVGRRIRQYIRAKEKLIALLEEQKQAVIHQAVTGQIDVRTGEPYPAYRKSNLDWLPEVPAHWSIRRNVRLFVERNETGFGDLPVLEVSLRTGVQTRELEDGGRKQQMTDRDKYKRAAKGDLAYNMMRLWQGAIGLVPAHGLVSPAYVVARPLDGVEAAYYDNLFRTDIYKQQVNRNSRGIVSDRNRLYWDAFKRMASPFPPSHEQRRVVEHLQVAADRIDAGVDAARRQIALLREFRRRLTADVVTGKLDVRDAAAALP